MCELLLGQKRFDRALENYHQKYAFANATTTNWVQEMANLMPLNEQVIYILFCAFMGLVEGGQEM